MAYLTELLKAPDFPDDDKTRIARTLNSLLLVFLGGALVYLPITLFSAAMAYRWLLVIAAGAACLGLLRALHRGHVKAVAAVLSLTLWLIFTVSAFARGGIQAPGYAGYTVAVLVAGMTLNWRAGLVLTVVSIITGLAVVYAQTNGLILLHTYQPLEIWAAVSAFLLVIAIISRQTIEELVQTKSILQKREREYRSLVENSTDFIVRLDSRLRYRFVSSSLSRAMGIPFEDYVGKTNRELNMPDEHIQLWDRETQKVFETGKANTIEFTYVTEIGPRHLHARLTPEFGEDGSVETVLGIIRDITEMKNAERVLREAERVQIETAQKRELIELKERFIATASHDFRTPLTIIKADASMLQLYAERLPDERRLAKLVEIQKQVDRMIQLLNAVLTLSKANAGSVDFSPISVDLKAFCERIWDDMTRLDDEKHRAHHSYLATAQQIWADETLLQYILVNLLSNAFKYTPTGGAIQFNVSSDDQSANFEVVDQGCGIPEPDMKLLFEPFHRSSNVKNIEGTGLGLVIARKYVELHQGTIEVESREGHGTTFRVKIPIRAQS